MSQSNKKITAVIPVRSGSQRVPHKNDRPFSDTTLLERKIDLLKQVSCVDEIIVSSDCTIMLDIARAHGVQAHQRDAYYASSDCPNYEYWSYLAKEVGQHDHLMMVNCVAPFVDAATMESIVDQYFDLQDHDGIVTVAENKKFYSYAGEFNPVNYEKGQAPNSQLLKAIAELTFSVCISTRDVIMRSQSIYGENPYLYPLDAIQSFDIDHPHEFVLSEMLYKNYLLDEKSVESFLQRKQKPLKLLDCTIRDGGYINNWDFSREEVLDCYRAVSQAGFDYCEVGFKTNRELLPGKGPWCYCDEEDITYLRKSYADGCGIAVMAKVGTFKKEDFQPQQDSDIDMVRVLVAKCTIKDGVKYSVFNPEEFAEAREMIEHLLQLGYEVTLNIGCADALTDEDIVMICDTFHDLDLETLYLADTYGHFDEALTAQQINKIDRCLKERNSSMSIGFHAHNNMQNALSKTLVAIDHGCEYVDACIHGLGRAAGNLHSEILILELMKKRQFIGRLDVLPLLQYCEKYIRPLSEYKQNKFVFGYNILFAIAGALSLHPDYVNELIEQHDDLSITEMYELVVYLDQFTKTHERRNYDKSLIATLIKEKSAV